MWPTVWRLIASIREARCRPAAMTWRCCSTARRRAPCHSRSAAGDTLMDTAATPGATSEATSWLYAAAVVAVCLAGLLARLWQLGQTPNTLNADELIAV